MIIQSKLIPKGICVNLFGSFWARDISWIDKYVINHERIHTAQQRELLFIGFYILYLIEWIVRCILLMVMCHSVNVVQVVWLVVWITLIDEIISNPNK